MIALSCTKDAQDSILADPQLSKVVDIIDIRYWHYNTTGLWAPPAGKNMAPRQFMRKMKVGKTGYKEAYRAVREYTSMFPDKAVTLFAQQYPQYGWAILMAGGSLPNIPVDDQKFLSDVAKMKVVDNNQTTSGAYDMIGDGRYNIFCIDKTSGSIRSVAKKTAINGSYTLTESKAEQVYWIEKI